MLPFLDVPLIGSNEMYQTLSQIVRDVRLHIVITHSPDHPVPMATTQINDDHVEAGKAMRGHAARHLTRSGQPPSPAQRCHRLLSWAPSIALPIST